ncbi:MAG: enoyl-CoA hydratase/isomerase family protein [Candidatus Bathyarchaeia archaeon]
MKPSFQFILYEVRNSVAWITINRPEKLNALTRQMWRDITAALDLAEKEPAATVAAITGSGRAFCGGDDIKELDILTNAEAVKGLCDDIMDLFDKIELLNKPVIAAVNGLAYGGGCEIALASDIVIAAENTSFAQPEARVGVWPFFAALRLPSAVGKAKAMGMMLTGEPITAVEAERIGLVTKVVASDQLTGEVEAMAAKVSQLAPLGVRLVKRTVNNGLRGLHDRDLVLGSVGYLALTEDAKEGARAFLEKRKPIFRGV